MEVRVEDGKATIRTRNGHDYTSTFPRLAKAARGLDNCIIDGEICVIDKDGVSDFSALQAAMKVTRPTLHPLGKTGVTIRTPSAETTDRSSISDRSSIKGSSE